MPKIWNHEDREFMVVKRLDIDLPEDSSYRRKPYRRIPKERFEEYSPEDRQTKWEVVLDNLTLSEGFYRTEILNWEHEYGPGSWGKVPQS